MAWDQRLGQYDVRAKVMDHLGTLLDLKEARRPFPVSAEIHLSNVCNHRCHFCEAEQYLQANHTLMDQAVAERLVRDLAGLGTQGVVWSGGGEPLVHKGIFAILELAHGLGLANGLITNLSILPAGRAQALVEQCAWIRVSFNGGSRDAYRQVHGADHFGRVADNVRALAAARAERGAACPLSLSFVYTQQNLASVPDLVNLALTLDIDSVHIRPDQFEDVDWLRSSAVAETMRLARELPAARNSALTVSTSEYMEKQYLQRYPATCYAHFFTLSVTADGNVNFCKSRFDRPETNYGNVNSASIREIWNHEAVRSLEAQLRPRDCAGFCRQMHLNAHVEDVLLTPDALDTRFI